MASLLSSDARSYSQIAPTVSGSVARQRGDVPPPASSPKRTVLPSHVKVALCQKSKAGLWMRAIVVGFSTSLMSQICPSCMHAAAARSIALKTLMS